ncbi:GAF domain-containing SpoIIE family protein phosphatase [Calidifontibacillus oryziterrae]|uniref:GAF domain-containing SpoIIE family protein phosphatase n=1 Tax=Calidifontibacillus oryziterrae TaxID=1191699 RepID=UPI0002FA2DFA|nr:GAF domain-containing SpoIIE family protein phosphatase [Calidifontibacillus oryziterrae]
MPESIMVNSLSEKFNEATLNAFKLLSHSIGVRTFFVGKTTEETYSVLKVFNNNGCLVEEGVSVPIEESYCNMVFRNGHIPVIIDDTSMHPITSQLQLTKAANIGSYLGVPIILGDHSMFGTLCAVDPAPYKFTSADLELMQTLANFIGNAIDLGQAYERILTEEQRVQTELEIAKKVQTSVLPESIDCDNFKAHSFYQSSESLSGDMYSWFQIAPSKYCVIIIDVMGHGVSASLISMSIRSVLRSLITTIIEPELVMQELNRHIYLMFNVHNQTTYATAIYLVVDTVERTVEYVNAGHPYGLLVEGNNSITLLHEGCLPLGIFPDLNAKKGTIYYDEAATLLLYTDGLIDLIDPSIEKGIEILKSLLENQSNSIEVIRDIQTTYINGKVLTDDVCFVALTAN